MPSSKKVEFLREFSDPVYWGKNGAKDWIKQVVNEVDPRIKPFIKSLLTLGYGTESSCAGGAGHMTTQGNSRGFVYITQKLSPSEKTEIRKEGKLLGLSNIKFSTIAGESCITFDPLGGPSGKFSSLL